MIMKWEDVLQKKFPQLGNDVYNEIYKLCLDAYVRGSLKERTLAVEAHRLRCNHLFGNRCMNHTYSETITPKICDGKCSYMNKYVSELYKLET